MKRLLCNDDDEISQIHTLCIPSEIVSIIAGELLTITDSMSWYGCCNNHWKLYVHINRKEWLDQLKMKSLRLKEIINTNTSLHVKAYHNYAMCNYAIVITQLCTAIENLIPNVYKKISSIIESAEAPPINLYLKNLIKVSDYIGIGNVIDTIDILIFTQCRVFIKNRYGWVIMLEEKNSIFVYPWKVGTKIENKESFSIILSILEYDRR